MQDARASFRAPLIPENRKKGQIKQHWHDLAAPVMNRKPDLSIGLCHG
jgi:hypothetical protein